MYQHIQVPAQGQKITVNADMSLNVPDEPIVPYIEGDGTGADIEFTPADFRRFGPLLERRAPRVMTTVATPPDADGWCSLSLHAGGTIDELRRAGADPDRLLVVVVSDAFPRTGVRPTCRAPLLMYPTPAPAPQR